MKQPARFRAGRFSIASALQHFAAVLRKDLLRFAVFPHGAVFQPDRARAVSAHGLSVRNDQKGKPGGAELVQLCITFFCEGDISDGEDFVDQQNFRGQIDRDGKAEAGEHAGGICFDGRPQKIFQFRKVCYRAEARLDFGLCIAEYGGIQVDILFPRCIPVKTGTEFEQGRDPSAADDLPAVRMQDPGHDFEQRAFPRRRFFR